MFPAQQELRRKPAKIHLQRSRTWDKQEALLSHYKAKFIVIIKDLPEMRHAFRVFKVKRAVITYSASKEGGTEGKELLVSNFQPIKLQD